MNEIAVVNKGADWRRLKALVLDSVSSPITKRVYNLGLGEFFAGLHEGDREVSAAVRKSETVAPSDPVMPVADGFIG